MGGLRASMDDFSADGLDSLSDAGSLAEPEPVSESIFDDAFDPSALLKEPLFDEMAAANTSQDSASRMMMMEFNKSSAAEEAFGTYGDMLGGGTMHGAGTNVPPPVVPATPTDSGTSSPYATTPREFMATDYATAMAPQGLPLMVDTTNSSNNNNYSMQQQAPIPRISSPSQNGMGYSSNNNVPPMMMSSPYGNTHRRNSPPSPPMLSNAHMNNVYDMNTSPSVTNHHYHNGMPPDMISVTQQSMSNSVQSDLRSVSSYDRSLSRQQQQQHMHSSPGTPLPPHSQASPSASTASGGGGGGAGQEIKSFNEAMEKLCESMKRSAMSRNLVKQLSGRNLAKQGSSRTLASLNKQGSMRSLPRQGSGRFQMAKELSNHSLHTQLSSRSLHKQLSGRSLSATAAAVMAATNGGNPTTPNGDNSGRVTPTANVPVVVGQVPVRRMSIDMKHRMSPGRGMFRQKSSGSLNGRRAQSAILQIDDMKSAMGIFYPTEDTIHA